MEKGRMGKERTRNSEGRKPRMTGLVKAALLKKTHGAPTGWNRGRKLENNLGHF